MKESKNKKSQGFDAATGLRKLLEQPCDDPAAKEKFEAYSLKKNQQTNGMLLLIHLMESARSGNSTAIREVLNLCGSGGGKEAIVIDDVPLE